MYQTYIHLTDFQNFKHTYIKLISKNPPINGYLHSPGKKEIHINNNSKTMILQTKVCLVWNFPKHMTYYLFKASGDLCKHPVLLYWKKTKNKKLILYKNPKYYSYFILFLYKTNQILEKGFEDKIVSFFSGNINWIGNTCTFLVTKSARNC